MFSDRRNENTLLKTQGFPLCCGASIYLDFYDLDFSERPPEKSLNATYERLLKLILAGKLRGISVAILNDYQNHNYKEMLLKVGFNLMMSSNGNHGYPIHLYALDNNTVNSRHPDLKKELDKIKKEGKGK